MASSTDVIGLLTRNSEETAYLLDVLAGKDAKDATSIDRQDTYSLVSSSTKQIIVDAVEHLRKSGVEVVEVSIPSIDLALACYYIIVPAEISSNLSRYDGQRYGHSTSDASNLEASYAQSRGTGFNSENKRRIMIGTYVLSSGYYDAYYKKAAKLRTKLINEFMDAYKTVDILIGPTAPSTAPKIGENSDDPLKMYLLDIMTVPVNLVGVPAISIPCGSSDGMPVGLQIIGQSRMDKELLEFAKQCEGALK